MYVSVRHVSVMLVDKHQATAKFTADVVMPCYLVVGELHSVLCGAFSKSVHSALA